jgi:plasmid maintenance system antidote protein VapI
MKNPPHPGELVGDTLNELEVSIVDAAKGLAVTRQQLHNLIAGRSGI